MRDFNIFRFKYCKSVDGAADEIVVRKKNKIINSECRLARVIRSFRLWWKYEKFDLQTSTGRTTKT